MFGCYIDRDLSFGSFGFDVSCLQHHLSNVEARDRKRFRRRSNAKDDGSEGRGLFAGKMTGYYGHETRDAVAAWQDKFRVKGEPGVFCFSTRKAYAKKYGLPDPDENLMSEIDFDDQGKPRECLDVCSEFNGIQDCKTKCVVDMNSVSAQRRKDKTSKNNKYHACKAACQASYGISCDRAYPMTLPDGQSNYTSCLETLPGKCEQLCTRYKS